jgi:superfamily II DNA or RNA helicase/HKD family nuclease/diadenosine tetraphosphate (Ap4A) HIT family hydrolase
MAGANGCGWAPEGPGGAVALSPATKAEWSAETQGRSGASPTLRDLRPRLSRLPVFANGAEAREGVALRRLSGGWSSWALGDRPQDSGQGAMTDAACPFCVPQADRIVFEDGMVRAIWDAFPVSPGHLLVVPRRHVATWFEASGAEKAAVVVALDRGRALLDARPRKPDGYNIGINIGEAAGQTVFHLHAHLIPRYLDDVLDPRGGVRHVIPGKGKYHLPTAPAGRARLVSGGEQDPLLPCLGEELAQAARVDIAVGFVMPSGLDRLEGHLRDFLRRGGRLRILTGDYLGITDPTALTRLIDLEGDRQIRVFETAAAAEPSRFPVAPVSFHPKAYIFTREDRTGIGFVGSSNLSDAALTTGVEWNYRTVASGEAVAFEEIRAAFEKLFQHPATRQVTADWIRAYRDRRPALVSPVPAIGEADAALEIVKPPEPHAVQQEALAALKATRADGNAAGLVVLATGLGKTWLAAFDANPHDFKRVLFVAHRDEILNQSRDTFRRIRPESRLGFYRGEERHPDADVLFASIQTLSRLSHLERFPRDAFDYVVVDEFHHASAGTYRRLLDYFRPRFLLGLTATPERRDGGDLLALCQENLVYRCDVLEGIRRDLLCRFEYFGVPDDVDYRNIPWRNTRFDEQELTARLATETRAQNAYEQLVSRGGTRTLAFCVSQRHADFMADFLGKKGLRAVAVHSGATSAPRAQSLDELSSGHLQVICAVDVFNEGLDLPELDTVLMLRPTESRVVWLQQFGRGLRRTLGAKTLKVIDYIGNHRTFLVKPLTLFDLTPGSPEILNLLERARLGPIEVAPGCFVTYDLRAIDILVELARVTGTHLDALKRYYQDFKERHGARPTATEAFHDGYNPRALRRQAGSWLGFVRSMGDLDVLQQAAQSSHQGFLTELETTPMTKSYKMLVLAALLNEDRFPGEIAIEALGEAVLGIASRNQRLRDDLGPSADSAADLRRHLEQNPIDAWTGGKGTGGTPYFAYEAGAFRTTFGVDVEQRAPLQALTREIADWRLAEYLDRSAQQTATAGYVCRVSHSSGRPILRLPDREANPGLPVGLTPLDIDEVKYEAVFAEIAVNMLRQPGQTDNRLAEVLRGWFGADAGRPGTRHEVALDYGEAAWRIRPLGRTGNGLELWRRYTREQIPPLFGLTFSDAVWNVGFVVRPGHAFLLVTLDKRGKASEFQYRDHFVSPTEFQWQSQNRTRRSGKHGKLISGHGKQGIPVHLFVRRSGKMPAGGPRRTSTAGMSSSSAGRVRSRSLSAGYCPKRSPWGSSESWAILPLGHLPETMALEVGRRGSTKVGPPRGWRRR